MLIDRKPRTRIVAAFAFVAAYQALHMFTSYGIWSVHGRWSLQDDGYTPLLVRLIPMHGALFDTTLNGGPLGPLSWCMMLLFGSVAYDLMKAGNEKKFLAGALAWSVGLCAAGYALRIEWPGFKEAWPFSARYMTAPFPLWSTGLCFLQLLAFHLICGKVHLRIPTFAWVGMNPLLIYILHLLFVDVAEGFRPEQLSLVTGLVGFAAFYGCFAGIAYYLYRRKIRLKL